MYPNGSVEVPPLSSEELEALTELISQRSADATSCVSNPVPVANVSIFNCRFCSVRQLCDSYWNQAEQKKLREEQSAQDPAFSKTNTDIEVRLLAPIGPRVWKVKVIAGMFHEPETEILIHFGDLTGRWLGILTSGSRVRLLNVFLIAPSDEEETATPAIGIKQTSEVFVVTEPTN